MPFRLHALPVVEADLFSSICLSARSEVIVKCVYYTRFVLSRQGFAKPCCHTQFWCDIRSSGHRPCFRATRC